MPDRIVLLGAEKQAATSAALAYPERQFRFVSDQPVLDGWDLPNVTFTYGTPGNVQLEPGEQAIALCPRWLPAGEQKPLSQILPIIAETFSYEVVLPVSATPFPGQPCIVKGDRWHRPDGTIIGTDLDPADIGDPYGCGAIYQPLWKADMNILVVGRVQNCTIRKAVFRIHAESCARDDILASGETIDDPDIRGDSNWVLTALDYEGLFTMNWLRRGTEYRLTSFRPVPRAVFGTLRKPYFDLLGPAPDGDRIALAGHKFVVDLTYTSYRRLVA